MNALFALLTFSSAASICFLAESNDGRVDSAVLIRSVKLTEYSFVFILSFKITFASSGIPTALASSTDASSKVFFALIKFNFALPKLYSA